MGLAAIAGKCPRPVCSAYEPKSSRLPTPRDPGHDDRYLAAQGLHTSPGMWQKHSFISCLTPRTAELRPGVQFARTFIGIPLSGLFRNCLDALIPQTLL